MPPRQKPTLDTPADATPAPARLLTVAEVARQCHVSSDHVRRAIERGALSAVDLRSPGATRAVYRVAPENLRAWLDEERAPAVIAPTPLPAEHDLRSRVGLGPKRTRKQ